jgi:hypothetical protein
MPFMSIPFDKFLIRIDRTTAASVGTGPMDLSDGPSSGTFAPEPVGRRGRQSRRNPWEES